MNIPEQIREHLTEIVVQSFPREFIEDISVEDITVDAEAGEIRITLLVSTSINPREFAKGYFGLTGKMRQSLANEGEKWGNFFPIITPAVGNEVHA